MTQTEVIEGTVEAVNDRGVRLNGNWYNVSKFKTVALPSVGERVRLGIDTKGFIMDLQVEDQDDEQQLQPTATRLAVLQAAAVFGASRPDLKSAEVLRIAQTWLDWVESAE